jgi:hypothetical protein
MKKLICVNKIYEKFRYRQSEFTYGKSYLVLDETDTHYLIRDDFEKLSWVFKNKEEINFVLDTSKLTRKLKLEKLKRYEED